MLATGCTYEGDTDSGRFHGQGTFHFANGTKYVGSFKDGMFHGEGTMHLHTGGKYSAMWDNGKVRTFSFSSSSSSCWQPETQPSQPKPSSSRCAMFTATAAFLLGDVMFCLERVHFPAPFLASPTPRSQEVEGSYEFKDGLQYDSESWSYCTSKDRRFFTEYKEGGLKPAGESLFQNNPDGKELPEGCYDVGDGYIDPAKDSSVRKFGTGRILRPTQPGEAMWARKTCRIGRKKEEDEEEA